MKLLSILLLLGAAAAPIFGMPTGPTASQLALVSAERDQPNPTTRSAYAIALITLDNAHSQVAQDATVPDEARAKAAQLLMARLEEKASGQAEGSEGRQRTEEKYLQLRLVMWDICSRNPDIEGCKEAMA
ncbi:MAG: hypothetical protein M1829_000956 [Trizodia sp. TS-e1964]|nr:MAG: hypothetical protein M1829_000956 [Trizodia sp. TS-e1964]